MKTEPTLRLRTVGAGIAATLALAGASPALADEHERATATPIAHVIIIVGENRTFDHLYGKYQPNNGQKVANLLSRGIVNAEGSAGPRVDLALQHIGRDEDRYRATTASTGVR